MTNAFAESFSAGLAQHSRLDVQVQHLAPNLDAQDVAAALRRARGLGAAHVVMCALEREGEGYRATLTVLGTRTQRIRFTTTRRVPEDRLPALLSQLAVEVTQALGSEAAPVHDWFLYSHRSPELAVSPLGQAALEAAQGSDVMRMLTTSAAFLEAHPRAPDALLLRAYALLNDDWVEGPAAPAKRRAFEAGLEALRAVDAANPWDDALAAVMAARDGNLPEAIAGFSGVLSNPSLTPSARAVVLSFRGQAHRDRGDGPAALRDLEEAVRLDATNEYTLAIAADNLGTFGDPLDGLLRARQAVAVAPSRPHAQFALAAAYGRLGRWSEALPHAQLADRLAPSQDYCAYLAMVLRHCGQLARAAEECEQARRRTESSWGQWMLARYDATAGDHERALLELERAFDLGYADPELPRLSEFRALRGSPRFEALWSRMSRRFAAPSL